MKLRTLLTLLFLIIETSCGFAAQNGERIEEIKIQGIKKTKEQVIRQEIKIKEGDLFNTKRIEEDIQRLENLEILDSVEYKTEYDERTKGVRVIFEVEDDSMLFPDADFGSEEGKSYWKIGMHDHNFLGNNEELELWYGQKDKESFYDLTFCQPRVFGSLYLIGLSIHEGKDNEEEYKEGRLISSYEKEDNGGNIKIGKKIDDKRNISLSFNTQDVTSILDKKSPNSSPMPKNGKTNSLTLCGEYGRINTKATQLFEGSLHSLSVENAGRYIGSDFDFTRLNFEHKRFVKLDKNKNFCWRILGGKGCGLEIQHQYELGKFVRGDTAYRFKGDNLVVFNTEYRQGIIDTRRWMLQGVGFTDIGNVWEEEFGKLKISGGIGLRVMFKPIIDIPFRIDYAQGISELKRGAVSFGFEQFFSRESSFERRD